MQERFAFCLTALVAMLSCMCCSSAYAQLTVTTTFVGTHPVDPNRVLLVLSNGTLLVAYPENYRDNRSWRYYSYDPVSNVTALWAGNVTRGRTTSVTTKMGMQMNYADQLCTDDGNTFFLVDRWAGSILRLNDTEDTVEPLIVGLPRPERVAVMRGGKILYIYTSAPSNYSLWKYDLLTESLTRVAGGLYAFEQTSIPSNASAVHSAVRYSPGDDMYPEPNSDNLLFTSGSNRQAKHLLRYDPATATLEILMTLPDTSWSYTVFGRWIYVMTRSVLSRYDSTANYTHSGTLLGKSGWTGFVDGTASLARLPGSARVQFSPDGTQIWFANHQGIRYIHGFDVKHFSYTNAPPTTESPPPPSTNAPPATLAPPAATPAPPAATPAPTSAPPLSTPVPTASTPPSISETPMPKLTVKTVLKSTTTRYYVLGVRADGSVLYRTGGREIYSYDAATNTTRLWAGSATPGDTTIVTTKLNMKFYNFAHDMCSADGNTFFVVATTNNRVYRVNDTEDTVEPLISVTRPSVCAVVRFRGGLAVYVRASRGTNEVTDGGSVYRYDIATGSLALVIGGNGGATASLPTSRALDAVVRSSFSGDRMFAEPGTDNLLLSIGSGKLCRFEPAAGTIELVLQLPGEAHFTVSGKYVYVLARELKRYDTWANYSASGVLLGKEGERLIVDGTSPAARFAWANAIAFVGDGSRAWVGDSVLGSLSTHALRHIDFSTPSLSFAPATSNLTTRAEDFTGMRLRSGEWLLYDGWTGKINRYDPVSGVEMLWAGRHAMFRRRTARKPRSLRKFKMLLSSPSSRAMCTADHDVFYHISSFYNPLTGQFTHSQIARLTASTGLAQRVFPVGIRRMNSSVVGEEFVKSRLMRSCAVSSMGDVYVMSTGRAKGNPSELQYLFKLSGVSGEASEVSGWRDIRAITTLDAVRDHLYTTRLAQASKAAQLYRVDLETSTETLVPEAFTGTGFVTRAGGYLYVLNPQTRLSLQRFSLLSNATLGKPTNYQWAPSVAISVSVEPVVAVDGSSVCVAEGCVSGFDEAHLADYPPVVDTPARPTPAPTPKPRRPRAVLSRGCLNVLDSSRADANESSLYEPSEDCLDEEGDVASCRQSYDWCLGNASRCGKLVVCASRYVKCLNQVPEPADNMSSCYDWWSTLRLERLKITKRRDYYNSSLYESCTATLCETAASQPTRLNNGRQCQFGNPARFCRVPREPAKFQMSLGGDYPIELLEDPLMVDRYKLGLAQGVSRLTRLPTHFIQVVGVQLASSSRRQSGSGLDVDFVLTADSEIETNVSVSEDAIVATIASAMADPAVLNVAFSQLANDAEVATFTTSTVTKVEPAASTVLTLAPGEEDPASSESDSFWDDPVEEPSGADDSGTPTVAWLVPVVCCVVAGCVVAVVVVLRNRSNQGRSEESPTEDPKAQNVEATADDIGGATTTVTVGNGDEEDHAPYA